MSNIWHLPLGKSLMSVFTLRQHDDNTLMMQLHCFCLAKRLRSLLTPSPPKWGVCESVNIVVTDPL